MACGCKNKAANAGTSYKLNSGYVSSVFRSIYSRTLTMAYNANGAVIFNLRSDLKYAA